MLKSRHSPKATTMLLSTESNCARCSLKPLCLARDLDDDAASRLTTILRRPTTLSPDEHLFWQSEALEALYLVRSGCLKTYATDAQGNERVRGFHFPGDIIGVDALHLGQHPANAQALTEVELCVLPLGAFERLADQTPALRRRLVEMASRELSTALALAGDYSADQRLAAFLLIIAERTPDHRHLSLDMSRRDIANYLRLAAESVSRVLARFRDDGLISVKRRAITLLDPARLAILASPVDLSATTGDARRQAA